MAESIVIVSAVRTPIGGMLGDFSGLALAGHQAVAHQDLVDGVAGDAGALDRGLDGDRAELVRGQAAEVAEHATDGRADGGDDDDVVHVWLSFCGSAA